MQNYPQMQPPIQAYTVPPKIVYNQGGAPAPAPAPTTQMQNPNPPQPLAHIPMQQDVLTLSTKPSNPVTPELNAQMPAPDIQNPPATQDAAEEKTEEKVLPSLNVGVVDAPNNGLMTPITDDINSRAQELQETGPYIPELKQEGSIVPHTLGKKALSAGKISAYLSLGSLGLILAMLIPKGISKIAKLIKHK